MKNFKLSLLAASAVAVSGLVSSGSASAADLYVEPTPERTISATVDIYGAAWWTGNGTDSNYSSSGEDDAPEIGGEARVDLPFNPNWSVQLDIGGSSKVGYDYIDDLSSEDEGFADIYLGGHLNYREMDNFLLGGFVGGGQYFHYDSPADAYVFGLEGQKYLGNLTLYGQVGFLTGGNDDEDTLEEGVFGRGVARYFVTPHQKLEGEFAYLSGEADDEDTDILSWGVEYEHQFAGTWGDDGAVSAFIGYKGYKAEADGDEETEHRFLAGIKIDLNTSSLLQRDRSGATLDLPDFTRWGSMGCALEC